MDFQLAIIGGGPAGYTAALHAAKKGLSVVLFERDCIGGVCLNRGCIPTKAVLHSAEVYNELKSLDFEAYGMTGSGSCLYALSYDKKKLEKAEKHFFLRSYQSDLTKIHK